MADIFREIARPFEQAWDVTEDYVLKPLEKGGKEVIRGLEEIPGQVNREMSRGLKKMGVGGKLADDPLESIGMGMGALALGSMAAPYVAGSAGAGSAGSAGAAGAAGEAAGAGMGGFGSSISQYFAPAFDYIGDLFSFGGSGNSLTGGGKGQISEGLLAGFEDKLGSGLDYGAGDNFLTNSSGSLGGITGSSLPSLDSLGGTGGFDLSNLEGIMDALKSVKSPEQVKTATSRVGGGGGRVSSSKNMAQSLLDREYEALYNQPLYKKLTKDAY